ncbi:MAG: hypothetical protein QME32_04435 [Endomicrobiia bacterium]|nr:hypothetical protein [Endomicrobiia bacterium]
MKEPTTLKNVAEEIRRALNSPEANTPRTDGDPWIPVRNFLDDFYSNPNNRQEMIDAEPEPTGDKRFDVYLAALAEHLAYHYDMSTPHWATGKKRFLATWWFPTEFKSLRAMALVESPASFRRRGIFVDHTEFQRI